MLRGPVLVGTNLTPEAEGALRQGAALARDLGAPLIVCHVMPELLRIGMLFPQWRGVDPALVDAMTTKARDAVNRELESILGDPPLLTEVVLDSGTPHTGVLAQAARAGAGIIVIGPGEVAAQIARHAPVPVLVARPSPAGCVVGATDFSDPSLRTLRVAAAEARRREVPLHLVYALDVGLRLPGSPPVAQPYLEGLAGMALDGVDELRTAAEERLADLLREFSVEGQTAVVSGHAEGAIVGYAERVGAGLVVVGRHGGSGFAQLTLGSTATGVIESAPCSVLISRVSAPPSLRVAADTGRAGNSGVPQSTDAGGLGPYDHHRAGHLPGARDS
jgi:nucleotide-binding universal stress UspA family protein